MQINGSSSFSYRPTQLPAQLPTLPSLSPEAKNKLQDAMQEGLATRQATQEAQETAKRTAVVGYTAAQNKQDSIEMYVSASTGNDVEGNEAALGFNDLQEMQQRQQLAQSVQTLDTLAQVDPLQKRIDGMVGMSNQQGSLFSTKA